MKARPRESGVVAAEMKERHLALLLPCRLGTMNPGEHTEAGRIHQELYDVSNCGLAKCGRCC